MLVDTDYTFYGLLSRVLFDSFNVLDFSLEIFVLDQNPLLSSKVFDCLLESLLDGGFAVSKRSNKHIKCMAELLPVQLKEFIKRIGVDFCLNHLVVFLQVVENVRNFLFVFLKYAS